MNEEPRTEVFVDSDSPKAEDRRSVSGGIVVIGKAGVKHWSRTQATRSLSSGEAEYGALVIGCAEGLGTHGADEGPGSGLENPRFGVTARLRARLQEEEVLVK